MKFDVVIAELLPADEGGTTFIASGYVSSCDPENDVKGVHPVTEEIKERVKTNVMDQIERTVENYDFRWAVDDAMESADFTSFIEETIFEHLCENINTYVGDIAEEIIEEEVFLFGPFGSR
ncbi:MAG: hypothetical protein IK085_06360 [Clostridia bacterium]|nr:hypothetical protein [Clostridia bacterium]